MKKLLVVIYDVGAAGPVDIAAAARDICDIVFVCDPHNPHTSRHLGQLHQAGSVVEIADPGADDVSRVIDALGADGITTFSEYQMRLTAAAAARSGHRFHDPAVAALLTDKTAQRQSLRENGIDQTRFAPVENASALDAAISIVGFPAVLKPRNGAASMDTYLVESTAQAHRMLDGNGSAFILEEYLSGDPEAAGRDWGQVVSVESLVVDGSVHSSHVTGRFPLAPPFRETGLFAPSTLAPELCDRVTALAESAIAALGVRWGITHTEVKLTPSGPRIVEVNGRLGGYVGDVHLRAGGPDLLRASIMVALGLPLPDLGSDYARVAFQHYLPAPPYKARLDRLDGLDRAEAITGVTHVEPRAVVGQDIDWRKGTLECLAVAFGTATDHDTLAQTIRRITEAVRPQYTPASGNDSTVEATDRDS